MQIALFAQSRDGEIIFCRKQLCNFSIKPGKIFESFEAHKESIMSKLTPFSLFIENYFKHLEIALLMSPIFFVLYYGVKEKKIEQLKENASYDDYEKHYNHRVMFFVYFGLSFAILMFIAFLEKG